MYNYFLKNSITESLQKMGRNPYNIWANVRLTMTIRQVLTDKAKPIAQFIKQIFCFIHLFNFNTLFILKPQQKDMHVCIHFRQL